MLQTIINLALTITIQLSQSQNRTHLHLHKHSVSWERLSVQHNLRYNSIKKNIVNPIFF